MVSYLGFIFLLITMNKLLSLALVSAISLTSISSLAYADKETHMERSSRASAVALTEVQLTCLRTAVSTRETGIRTAYSTLTVGLLAGMDARAKALDAAWMLSDKMARKTAREAAWSTWDTTAKTARETFKTARKTTWDTFRTSTKTCKVSSNEADSKMSQASDVQ